MNFIDTDNAMGSPQGDVDDGFALTALLVGDVEISGLGSVFGNSSEELAHRNNQTIGSLCNYQGPYYRGANKAGALNSEVGEVLAKGNFDRIICLGPLTNLAGALQKNSALSVREVLVVGSNFSSNGRWPPFWPFEYNFTKDKASAKKVLESDLPLTVLPLDVARKMKMGFEDLKLLKGSLGDHLRSHSKRWFDRAKNRGFSSVPIWDLVAAVHVLQPSLFEREKAFVKLHENGWTEYGNGKEVSAITRFKREAIWNYFASLL